MVRKLKKVKRWVAANKLFFGLFALIAIIAIIDSLQIITFHTINTEQGWSLYNKYTLPSFILLWSLLIVVIAFVYWVFARDISEAIGLALAGLILLFTGLEDVFYFLFSKFKMTECMQWFNDLNAPVSFFSRFVFREECTSPASLITFSIIGIFLAYGVFEISRRKF